MNTARRPVRRQQNPGDEYDLSGEHLVAPELDILRAWLPEAMPTDGQPYEALKKLRHRSEDPPARIHPHGIDSGGSFF